MTLFARCSSRKWPAIIYRRETVAASPRVAGSLSIFDHLGPFRTFNARLPRPPGSYKPKSTAHLRQFILPDTWRGRIIACLANRHWRNVWKNSEGQTRPKNESCEKGPLSLYFDDRPTASPIVATMDSVICAWRSNLVRLLWRIAQPVPWSTKSRWIRWPAYLGICFYSIIFLIWIKSTEDVPITGRRQCRFFAFELPPLKEHDEDLSISKTLDEEISQIDNPHHKAVLEDFKSRLLLDEDPRVKQLCSIMDRILSASGLKHLRYLLCVVEDPSKCSDL